MISESAAWRLSWFDADAWFHLITLYTWMRIERVPRTSAQFENLNSRLRPALDLKPCLLARRARSIRIQQNGAWEGIVGVIIGMLVSVLHTR